MGNEVHPSWPLKSLLLFYWGYLCRAWMTYIWLCTQQWCQAKAKQPRLQGSRGPLGAHLGPTGPRWAPCWPHAIWERFHWLFWPNVIYRTTYNHGDIVLCFAVIKSWPNQTKLRQYKTRIMSFKFQWYISAPSLQDELLSSPRYKFGSVTITMTCIILIYGV